MEAVVGSVPQPKPIELAKAASVFTRFAATAGAESGGGVQHTKATYLRLASSAFDELVRLQGDVGVREKEKKKRVKRSNDGRKFGEGEERGWRNVEVVDSDVKRQSNEVKGILL